jgi:hypothetical protein
VRKFLPGYMTMGHRGMGEMFEMEMPMPRNSIPMKGGEGPFGHIDMAGMFTIVKVHPRITTYEDPGWYRHPPRRLPRGRQKTNCGGKGSRPNDDAARRELAKGQLFQLFNLQKPWR